MSSRLMLLPCSTRRAIPGMPIRRRSLCPCRRCSRPTTRLARTQPMRCHPGYWIALEQTSPKHSRCLELVPSGCRRASRCWCRKGGGIVPKAGTALESEWALGSGRTRLGGRSTGITSDCMYRRKAASESGQGQYTPHKPRPGARNQVPSSLAYIACQSIHIVPT